MDIREANNWINMQFPVSQSTDAQSTNTRMMIGGSGKLSSQSTKDTMKNNASLQMQGKQVTGCHVAIGHTLHKLST